MKNRLLILVSLFSFCLGSWGEDYAPHSVLQNGNFVKIQVAQTGIHCLTYDEIADMGLQPENIRIFGYGGNLLNQDFTQHHPDDVPAVSFYMHKGADGVFNSGDYILFYARGPIGWKQQYDSYSHTRNCYDNYGYYFLSDNAGEQHLISLREAIVADSYTNVDNYDHYQLHEQDLVNLVDIKGMNGGGREWYGEKMNNNSNTLNIPFTFEDVDTGATMYCKATVAAKAGALSQFKVSINGVTRYANTAPIDVSDAYTMATLSTAVLSDVAQSGNTCNVNIQFSNSLSDAVGYLNYIELVARCKLILRGNSLAFRHYDMEQENGNRFRLLGADNATMIWDVSDVENICQVPATFSGDTLCFTDDNLSTREYVAVRPNANGWLKPTVIGRIANQDLHRLSNIDYVIITPEIFLSEAQTLARKHEEINHVTTAVVTDRQVYNEYSSGTKDASAIRWFMRQLYDRAQGNPVKRPKNLCLMGIGSFDNRKISPSSGNNLMITYQAENSTVETKAYVTDDYFAFMENNAGMTGSTFMDVRGRMAFGVGRIPAATQEEAANAVNKICRYMDNATYGKWKHQICFLADDGDHGLHVQTADYAAEALRQNNPDFVVNKIYLDAYAQEVTASGESYPIAYNQFANFMQNGVLFMDYSGHGSANNICSEGFLTISDVQAMQNANLGLWALATCSFSHYDQRNRCSAAEAVLNPNGGAIGVFSATRTVYASNNKILNNNFCAQLFSHTDVFDYGRTVGEAAAAAKNRTGNDDNKMAYCLLGDPGIRIHFPNNCQVVTTTQMDTLHAMDIQDVDGYIRTQDADSVSGDTATWFNGKLQITIYDKLQAITTMDNDEQEESKKQRYTYNDHPNRLFQGETEVKDGKFHFQFMLPKDIRYQYGNGRIVYYAYDEILKEEAIGHEERFIVGGSSTVQVHDSLGPEMRIYLNTPSFCSGDETHETPRFFADIYDQSGINTVGSGIGHDLLLVVDNDIKQTYILNDYFTAASGSYREGQVSYLFSELAEGAHQLSFRAWDLLNNSSTAYLNFNVAKGRTPYIYNIVTYPNPCPQGGTVNFYLDTDRYDDIIQSDLYIYNISGQLVNHRTFSGTSKIQIPVSELGNIKGTYIYHCLIKTPSTTYSSKKGKLMVY